MPRLSEFKLDLVRHGSLVVCDLLINGIALAERIRRHEGEPCDRISPLGLIEGAFARLALESQPDLPGGRTSLLVCPSCGDLGCGAVSAVIERVGSTVVWKEIGIANDLGIEDEGPFLFRRVTSFRFDWKSYSLALRRPQREIR